MLKTIAEEEYPSLYQLMYDIAAYNGAINREETINFVLPDTYDFASMDRVLASLSEDEFYILADGEEMEMRELIQRKPELAPIDRMISKDWWEHF
jgi:hypothetical protein